MEHEINITIDGIAYKRVEAKYPEMQCEECDWHDICGNELCKKRHKAIAFCTGCQFLEPNGNYIFKKKEADTYSPDTQSGVKAHIKQVFNSMKVCGVNATDVRQLSELGIPVISLMMRNISPDDLEEWCLGWMKDTFKDIEI